MSSDSSKAGDPPGLPLGAVVGWLDRERPGLRQGPLRAALIAGGRSNLTYRVTDGESVWAIRRPPLGHVLPTAHDMVREYTVISALRHTDVPVPQAIALCTDAEVIGQPFYVMSFVDGVVLDSPELISEPVAARRTGELLVDTLLALHSVDPSAVGLGDFGRPQGYLQRQVARWHKQYLASQPAGTDGSTQQELELSVAGSLAEALPATSRVGIVHGDYRLTNVIYAHRFDRIAAVVDWEMATLGDPLTDVGLLYVYHRLSAGTGAVMAHYPAAAGYLDADALVARYAASGELELRELDWYIAFGYFKLAVIAAGIDARFRQGLTVGEGFERFGALVGHTLRGAADTISAMTGPAPSTEDSGS
ncbi:phosphotransferase family protein [Jatrophihabitans telluris]|uniref:Phosphotransferase family protein n=1 Tax=Jatrophihabitans telluris TaxID=2038343 RepID=A0ABY4R4P2_9ACTN|nr:phosphotransferase family protein [Jatrophihabitans telluris]UQX89986.1 phosphotransferase family protein [Jatrophihabitans telluris]